MKRNKGLDIVRTFAVMAVLIYHFYVLVDNTRYLSHPMLHKLISIGGEVGVTLFFIISGYGIYLSIDRKINSGEFSYKTFLAKRFNRILPHYYLSLLIIIFIGTQGFVISKNGFFHIFTHALLIHNFFPSTCGSISTVLWTMGVIFQFYFVSIFLYKLLKKNPVVVLIGSVVFTVFCKIMIFHFIFPYIEIESSYYFIYGRQLFTALDNFIIGMFLAYMSNKTYYIEDNKKIILSIFSIMLSVVWCVMPQVAFRYSDTIMGYIWNSCLAILLGIGVWVITEINLKKENVLMKIILFISKYQYGIYLWHFVVAANLLQNSSVFSKIANASFLIVAILLSIVCILVGYIATITLEAPDYSQLLKQWMFIFQKDLNKGDQKNND